MWGFTMARIIWQGWQGRNGFARSVTENVMEWFGRTTSIAGIEIPNWVVVLGAIVVIWLIYTFI